MRPSSTSRSMPSRATVEPYVLRSPRASMYAIGSALLRGWMLCVGKELVLRQAEPPDPVLDPGPLLVEKLPPFALEQHGAGAGIHEHDEPAPRLHQSFVHQFLVPFQDREWIDPIFRRHRAHRRQGLAFLDNVVEDHRDDAIPKLAVDGLTVVPLTFHQ